MQQINLYLPEFQPNREPLRSVHMLWGLVLFIVLLIVVSVLSAQSNHEREVALEQRRGQLDQLKAQVAQLEQQRPRANLSELDAQIVLLSQELERREQILSIIANKNLGNNSGFSAYLAALGRQSLDSVSLAAFSLQQGGSYAEFAGTTHTPDQVPLYIQRLRGESAFTQSAFGVLNIEPMATKQGAFDFWLVKQSSVPNDRPETKTAVEMLLKLNEKERGGR